MGKDSEVRSQEKPSGEPRAESRGDSTLQENSDPEYEQKKLPGESEKEKDVESSISGDIEKVVFPETVLDRGIVGWDGQDDPQNPRNFTNSKKWEILLLTSLITLISPLASSMFSPGVGLMAVDFKVTNEILLSFSVSVYLLGYTFGPLFIAPLSEIYGRRIVLGVSNWFFVIWQIGCAKAPNIASLIVFRFFAGIGGSACITLGAGQIADLFKIEDRGRATAIWGLGPLLGPVIGPICGGFIAQSAGWRWVFWVLLIAGGVAAFGIECLNHESYAPVIIRRKTKRLAKELNRSDLRSAYATNDQGNKLQYLMSSLMRPFILLIKSPIILLLSLYMAFVYGLLYLFFTTITSVFEHQYGFSTGLSGLAYIGIGLGFLAGIISVAIINDRVVVKLTKRNNGVYEPEMRLPALIFYACILPISFFWYGWSADKHTHWIVPIIGTVPFSFGMMGLFVPTQAYLIDAFPKYAASAIAALTAVRSLFGALLPLAGPKMFESLGLGWGNSLLGFIAIGFIPIPIFFSKYGKTVREKFPVD